MFALILCETCWCKKSFKIIRFDNILVSHIGMNGQENGFDFFSLI